MQSKALECGRTHVGFAGSNPAGDMVVFLFELYRRRPLRWDDPSSREVLQSTYLSLNMNRSNNNPLHIRLVGRRSQTKKMVLCQPVTCSCVVTESNTVLQPTKCVPSTDGCTLGPFPRISINLTCNSGSMCQCLSLPLQSVPYLHQGTLRCMYVFTTTWNSGLFYTLAELNACNVHTASTIFGTFVLLGFYAA